MGAAWVGSSTDEAYQDLVRAVYFRTSFSQDTNAKYALGRLAMRTTVYACPCRPVSWRGLPLTRRNLMAVIALATVVCLADLPLRQCKLGSYGSVVLIYAPSSS